MFTDLRPHEVLACPRHGPALEGDTRCQILMPRLVVGELELVACGLPLATVGQKPTARFKRVGHRFAVRRPRFVAERASTG